MGALQIISVSHNSSMQQLLHRVEDIFAQPKDLPPPRPHYHGPLYTKRLEKVDNKKKWDYALEEVRVLWGPKGKIIENVG